jgi:UDP-N-acetylglucosamine 2-epimerase (non-hydrolysing)
LFAGVPAIPKIDSGSGSSKFCEESSILKDLNLSDGLKIRNYGLLTIHRPANVDQKDTLSNLLKACKTISERLPIIFSRLKRLESTELKPVAI